MTTKVAKASIETGTDNTTVNGLEFLREEIVSDLKKRINPPPWSEYYAIAPATNLTARSNFGNS